MAKKEGDFYLADFALAAVHTFDQVAHVSSQDYSDLGHVRRIDVIEYGNVLNYVMCFDAECVSGTTAMLEHLKKKHPGAISQNVRGGQDGVGVSPCPTGLCV